MQPFADTLAAIRKPEVLDLKGITVELLRLRKAGVRLTSAEYAEMKAERGELILEKRDGGLYKKNGFITVAELRKLTTSASKTSAGSPLFDAVLVGIDDYGIVLQGFEIDFVDSRRIEYPQIWLAKPILDTGRN